MRLAISAAAALIFLIPCAATYSQAVRLDELTGNNTAACPADGHRPSQCKENFSGQQDLRPGVATPLFDPPPGNVSTEDIHGYLNHGANTKIFANFMLGFCTSGDAEPCHNNVRTGYNSKDKKTIAAQVEDLIRRHIDGAILSWNGDGTEADKAAVEYQKYVDKHHCDGGQCSPQYVIMYDGASMAYQVKDTGIRGTSGKGCGHRSGAEYENCVVAHIRNDLCYLNGHHFGNSAYLKAGGRPVLQFFPTEGGIKPLGPAPSWADVWVHVSQWAQDLPHNCGKSPYNADNGRPLLIFENAPGFSLPGSDGAYAWIKVSGTDPDRDQFKFPVTDEADRRSLAGFYLAARQHPQKQVWGAAFKGFNSSKAAWGPNRILDQQCGRLWIESLTESNRYYTDTALPYLQIVTWNDYNEGTEIESGIDNCYTVSATVDSDSLQWSLNPTNPAASLATVSHIEIYHSGDGRKLTLLKSVPPSTNGTLSLADLPRGRHQLYVRMVGKNSILNRISAPVEVSR